ncbi:pseudouridine synthase [Phakopsora pachyrhizi]|uniref:Pseudouridine synthase n=1 Tax=Phakopsora pachyrhizi TaxID=170000 RepID=A0AAV0B024_PHAPC|nr:pseudouridine synthase [Phakopsora pachyrhizi]
MDTGTLSEPPKDSKNPVPYSESHAIKNFEKDIDIFKARGPEEEKRLPNERFAVLLGYYGKGYQGSQVNPGMRTIEGEVFKALTNAGCISEENSAHPSKLILNPTSLNSVTNKSTLDRDKLQLLVSHNSFHSRSFCDSRTYEYSLPTYLFLPPKPGSSMYERLNLISIPGSDKKWSEWYEKGERRLVGGLNIQKPIQDENDEKLNSRFKISLMNRNCLTQFKGTHNFHNFTVGKEFNERNSIRIIRDVTALDPFIEKKMIGLLILMCRTRTPPSILPELYGPVKVGIPKAPGLGLILQSPHFTANKKVLEVNQQTLKQRTLKISDEELNNLIREPIEPIKHEEKIEKFKRDTLYARMWEEENQENGFVKDLFTDEDDKTVYLKWR